MVAIRNVIAVALFAAFVSAQGGMPHLTSDQWIAEAPVEAAGGTLALSWKDCGDSKTHAKVTAVTPSSITLGAKTTISGSGTVDEDVTGGTFSMTMKGIGGIKLLDCGGDASQQKSCDVKVGFIKIGTLSFGGVTFPVKAGTISGIPKVDVSLASSLPAAAATTTTELLVTSASGDKIICVDIFTKPATTSLVEEPALVAPLVIGMPALVAPLVMGMPHLPSDQWIAEAPVEAAGGTLALSWKDCGDSKTHAKVTAVTPSSITLGSKTTISGSGTVDEDVTGGTFTMTMKGIGGMKLLDCGGDASQQKSCDVKVGFIKIGTLAFGGVTFPVKKGTISGIPKVDVSLASSLPAAAATTTTNLLVTSASGDKIICVDIFTKPATTGLVEEPALVAPLVNESRTATTTSVQSGDCNNSTTINEGTNDKPCNQCGNCGGAPVAYCNQFCQNGCMHCCA